MPFFQLLIIHSIHKKDNPVIICTIVTSITIFEFLCALISFKIVFLTFSVRRSHVNLKRFTHHNVKQVWVKER